MKKYVLVLTIILAAGLATAQEDFFSMQAGGQDMLFGGQIIIDENKTGDQFIAGGQVTVNGNVDGSLHAYGGQVTVNGDVTGDLEAYGGNVQLNGVVEGNAMMGGGSINLGPGARIKGDLTYGSPQDPSEFQDKVDGKINAEEVEERAEGGFSVLGFIGSILTAAIVGGIIMYLLPKQVQGLDESIKKTPVTNILLGIVAFPAIGVLALLGFLILLLGWPISVALILATIIALLFCTIPVKLAAGEIIAEKILNKELGKYTAYLLGVVVYAVIIAIPYFGGIIRLLAVLVGFGAICRAAAGKHAGKIPAV